MPGTRNTPEYQCNAWVGLSESITLCSYTFQYAWYFPLLLISLNTFCNSWTQGTTRILNVIRLYHSKVKTKKKTMKKKGMEDSKQIFTYNTFNHVLPCLDTAYTQWHTVTLHISTIIPKIVPLFRHNFVPGYAYYSWNVIIHASLLV